MLSIRETKKKQHKYNMEINNEFNKRSFSVVMGFYRSQIRVGVSEWSEKEEQHV